MERGLLQPGAAHTSRPRWRIQGREARRRRRETRGSAERRGRRRPSSPAPGPQERVSPCRPGLCTHANTTSPHLGEQERLRDAGAASGQRAGAHGPSPEGSCTQQGGTRARNESWAAGRLGCKASGRDLGFSGQSLHPRRRPPATAGRGWRQGRPQQTQRTPPLSLHGPPRVQLPCSQSLKMQKTHTLVHTHTSCSQTLTLMHTHTHMCFHPHTLMHTLRYPTPLPLPTYLFLGTHLCTLSPSYPPRTSHAHTCRPPSLSRRLHAPHL